ncbi:MAG: anti-sigma factor [Terriglobales bacterium]|jgi:anti-sigma factor RsiW
MDKWTAQIAAYVDGELSATAMKEMDAHLRTCPACTADALQQIQFKRALQSAGRRYTPTAGFRQKVRQSIAAPPRRSAAWFWLPATAVLLLLVAATVTLRIKDQRLAMQHTYSELADLHVTALASPNPVDVVSSDRHTVKPWFEGKIPFAFNLPELQNPEITLVGGRVAYLGQAPGAELIYLIRKHQVSVFIFPERALSHLPQSDSTMQRQQETFNFLSWSQNGLRYFVIGDMSGNDLSKLADLFKNSG